MKDAIDQFSFLAVE